MTAASTSTAAARTATEASRPAPNRSRSTVAALRTSRRKARVLPALATLAVAGALTFSSPKPAEAGPLMDMCIELVDEWHADCTADAGNRAQKFACDWLGGVASIGCVIIGAGELAWPILT